MKTKSKLRKRLPHAVVIVVGILVAGVMGFTGSSKGTAVAEAPLLSVQVSHPIRQAITEWDEFTGRFEASNRVEVRARVSGYIESVTFEDGQDVQKGDVLFIIDQRPFKIALKEAQAAQNQAYADFKQATDNFNRIKSLRESGAVSMEEYERRQQAQAATQARLELAKAEVENAQLNLEFSKVTAPISGRVSRDLVNAGNLVSGGTTNSTLLTTIVATDPIHFYFTASESEFLKYSRLAQRGERGSPRENPNPIEVKLTDENEFAHKGHMDFINNEISRSTGTIEARAVLENPDGLLEPGMFGRARLQGRTNYEVLMVPDELINTNQTVKFVYTVTKDSIVKASPVQLGRLHKNKYRIIKEGLNEDDRIVVNNILKVRPETKVAYKEQANGTSSGLAAANH